MTNNTTTTRPSKIDMCTELRAELAKRIPNLIVTDDDLLTRQIQIKGVAYFGDSFSIEEKYAGDWNRTPTGNFYISLSMSPMSGRRVFNRKKDGSWDYAGIAEFLLDCVAAEQIRRAARKVEGEAHAATVALYQSLKLSMNETPMFMLDCVPDDPKMFRIKFQRNLNEESILRLLSVLRDHAFTE